MLPSAVTRSLCVVLLVTLASCGESSGPGDPAPPSISNVIVTPNPASSSTIGEQIEFSARATDAEGVTLPARFTWATSNENVATIDSFGVATTRQNGTVTIIATAWIVTSLADTITEDGTAALNINAPASVSGGGR
jgi:hypothetical protein